ncbi:MAG: hypothetical protein B6U86_06050, partial [Candidatus Altiarchaeales archaeon ex4484_43]
SGVFLYVTDTIPPNLSDPIPVPGGYFGDIANTLFQVNLTEQNVNLSINVTVFYRRQGIGSYKNTTLYCHGSAPDYVCNNTVSLSFLDGWVMEYFFNTTDLAGLNGELGNANSPLNATVDLRYPSSPENVSFLPDPNPYFDDDGILVVTWNPATDANGIKEYRIYVRENSGSYIFNGTSTVLNYTFIGSNGNNYSVNVTAVDNAGNENLTGCLSSTVITVDTIHPTKPTLLEPGNDTVSTDLTPELNWTTVTEVNFANYTIEVSDVSDFSHVNYTYTVNNRTQSNYSVTVPWITDTTWYWRVTAYDKAGNFNRSILRTIL